MATHSNIFAWEIPLTEDPGELKGNNQSDTTDWLSGLKEYHEKKKSTMTSIWLVHNNDNCY